MAQLFVLLAITFLIIEGKDLPNRTIKTKVNTQQHYLQTTITQQIYSIELQKLSSTKQEQPSKCRTVPKTVAISNTSELFRLARGNNKQRDQKVFDKLTTLNDQENIIEEFEIVGDSLFLITTDGTGYFIKEGQPNKAPLKFQTQFYQDQHHEQGRVTIVKNLKDRPLIIAKHKVSLCKQKEKICETLSGFQAVNNIVAAEVYSSSEKNFLFIIIGSNGKVQSEIHAYQITANLKLRNLRKYNQTYFKSSQFNIRAIVRTEPNRFLLLDFYYGIREIVTDNQNLNVFISTNANLFKHAGCFQIVSKDDGKNLVLACQPSVRSYFIMKLVPNQFGTYDSAETIFLHERLYQISFIDNLMIGRVYSGVRMFWSSNTSRPYPYSYHDAGSIFLHNAFQSKIRMVGGIKTIYLAAEDELLKYELKNIDPHIFCYSESQISEQYQVSYSIACDNQSNLQPTQQCHQNQQLIFESWQHKEVKFLTMLLPLVLSFVGVLTIAWLIKVLYRKYVEDIENAKLKYEIDDNDEFQTD